MSAIHFGLRYAVPFAPQNQGEAVVDPNMLPARTLMVTPQESRDQVRPSRCMRGKNEEEQRAMTI